jgi:hypothetical protein
MKFWLTLILFCVKLIDTSANHGVCEQHCHKRYCRWQVSSCIKKKSCGWFGSSIGGKCMRIPPLIVQQACNSCKSCCFSHSILQPPEIKNLIEHRPVKDEWVYIYWGYLKSVYKKVHVFETTRLNHYSLTFDTVVDCNNDVATSISKNGVIFKYLRTTNLDDYTCSLNWNGVFERKDDFFNKRIIIGLFFKHENDLDAHIFPRLNKPILLKDTPLYYVANINVLPDPFNVSVILKRHDVTMSFPKTVNFTFYESNNVWSNSTSFESNTHYMSLTTKEIERFSSGVRLVDGFIVFRLAFRVFTQNFVYYLQYAGDSFRIITP